MADKPRFTVTVLDPNSPEDRKISTYAYSEEQAKRNVMLREGVAESDIVSVARDDDDEDDDGEDAFAEDDGDF